MNFTDNSPMPRRYPADPQMDQALRDIAWEDDYNAGSLMPHTDRLLSQDTLPCEQEQPEQIEVKYEREPVLSRGDLAAGLFTVGLALLGLAVLVVLWMIRAGNS